MLNEVSLIGNLGKDPDIKTLDNGTQIARFSLATTEKWLDKDGNEQKKTEWHNIVAWKGLAKYAAYFKKGSTVFVKGKVEYREYQKDNEKKSITEIKAFKLINLTKKENSGSSFSAASNASQATPVQSSGDDDLPF